MLTPASFQVLTNTLQVRSSFTHLLLISSGPYYSSATLPSPGFSHTNVAQWFTKLPCSS